jgi:undecaprenyl-diphosphatase
MFRFTNKLFWIPLYALIILLVVWKYKKEAIWIILLAIACVGLTDFIVSGMMKPFFERLRPSRDPGLEGLVHLVNGYKGGKWSFASGHAATSFALATFIWLRTKSNLPQIWLLFAWSALFSYTRIYLGVHYPGDIIVGASIGILMAHIFNRLYRRILEPRARKTTLEG